MPGFDPFTFAAHALHASPVLYPRSFQTHADRAIEALQAWGVHNADIKEVSRLVLKSGNPQIVRAALDAFDRNQERLQNLIAARHAHAGFHAQPIWGGAPCPEAAVFWARANLPARAPIAAGLAHAILADQGDRDPAHIAMCRSFLLVPGWNSATTDSDHIAYAQVALAVLGRGALALELRRDVLDMLSQVPGIDAVCIQADALNPTYATLALARAYASTPALIQALMARKMFPSCPSHHKAMRLAAALPAPQEIAAILTTPTGIRHAAKIVRAVANGRRLRKGPAGPHTPEAQAKRAARAAKKAAALEAMPT